LGMGMGAVVEGPDTGHMLQKWDPQGGML
jgi:hypothetical protein